MSPIRIGRWTARRSFFIPKGVSRQQSQLRANPMKAIGLLIATIGAVSLLVSVIKKDSRIRTQWARHATVLAAMFILMWCAGTLLLLVRSAVMAPNVASATMLLKTAIGGMGAGSRGITLCQIGESRRQLEPEPTPDLASSRRIRRREPSVYVRSGRTGRWRGNG